VIKTKKEKKMGRFAVEFEIVNNQDLALAQSGHLAPAKVRRKIIKGTVDPGATLLVLPLAIAKELGLPIKKQKVKVRYADGRRGLRSEVDDIRIYLQGRDGIFTAIAEPNRETALIGAVVLEVLDFLVDCRQQRLVPRDPDYVLSEIE
jgi:predicted aspartyl protease